MKHLLSALVPLVLIWPVHGGDWPQFRGPDGSGVAEDKNPPVRWSATDNLRWQAELPGRGLSNPVVADGRLFVTCSSGWQQRRLHVLCFDERTGKKLWERQFWATGSTQSHPKTCMAAPTPVTDGRRVFALFASHDLAALDRDGNLLWFRSLSGDYPTLGNNVGMASSPVLVDNTVVLLLENAGASFALGVDADSGQNRWRVPRPRGINFVTPLVIERGGRAEVVLQSPEEIAALSPDTGKTLWKFTGGTLRNIPSPAFGNGLVLAPGDNFYALRPSGDGSEPEVVWSSRKLNCGYSSPLAYRGKVYALTSQGVLRCADAATGDLVWDLRLEGPYAASPVAADGILYCVNEAGATTVIKTGAQPEVLGVNRLDAKILATPVLANGALYLRSDEYLYCIGKK